LTTELEQSPYAFYAVTGSAAFLAAVVFVFGLRIMRRVRRVALTGPVPRRRFLIFRRQPPPAEISWNDFPLYMPGTDHLTGGPRVNSSAVTTVNVLKKKLAIWDWLFRRRNAVPSARVKWMRTQKVKSGAAEPVWINQQADQARARDAMRGQQMEAEQGRLRRAEGGPEDKAWEERMKAIEKIREGRLKAWDMGLWEPGCEGVWTSGRGKPKWAKD
jgi:magnesium transporter